MILAPSENKMSNTTRSVFIRSETTAGDKQAEDDLFLGLPTSKINNDFSYSSAGFMWIASGPAF